MRSTDVSSIIARGKTEHKDAGAGQWIDVGTCGPSMIATHRI